MLINRFGSHFDRVYVGHKICGQLKFIGTARNSFSLSNDYIIIDRISVLRIPMLSPLLRRKISSKNVPFILYIDKRTNWFFNYSFFGFVFNASTFFSFIFRQSFLYIIATEIYAIMWIDSNFWLNSKTGLYFIRRGTHTFTSLLVLFSVSMTFLQ